MAAVIQQTLLQDIIYAEAACGDVGACTDGRVHVDFHQTCGTNQAAAEASRGFDCPKCFPETLYFSAQLGTGCPTVPNGIFHQCGFQWARREGDHLAGILCLSHAAWHQAVYLVERRGREPWN